MCAGLFASIRACRRGPQYAGSAGCRQPGVPAGIGKVAPEFRTDSAAFAALIESRRNRPEEFFKVPAGRIDLCNAPIAVR